MKFRVKKSASNHTPHYYIQQESSGGGWIGMQTCTWEHFFPGRPWIESYSKGVTGANCTSTQTREDLKAIVADLNVRGANVKFEDTYREEVTA